MNNKPYFETKFWGVILHQNQTYLGYSVIVSKSKAKFMSEITTEEWLDFGRIVKVLESAYQKCFKTTMFNWTCLMNDAYKKNPPTPWVHWHFRPRYNHEVKVDEKLFDDPNFAHHYDPKKENLVEDHTYNLIIDKIKEFLK
jgi:diadenosine tetraphosphate (Ap4A) HIT family hydrolase